MDQAMPATFLLGDAIPGIFISYSRHAGLRGISLEIGSSLLLWLGWIVIGLGLNFFVRHTVPSPVDRWSMLFSFCQSLPVYWPKGRYDSFAGHGAIGHAYKKLVFLGH